MYKLTMTASVLMTLMMTSACAAKPNTVQNAVKSKAVSQAYVKPGAGIGYTHDLKPEYNANETVTFQLNLGESYRAGIMRVNITSDGVQLLSTGPSQDFDMGTNDEHQMSVSFNTGSNGRHYINVQALADTGDGNPMSRIFSIPVQVGPPTSQKPDVNMKTMEDGEAIVEMEAQEVIK